MSGKLYTYPDNFRAQKIEIAAKYSGYQLTLAKFVAGETNKTKDFLAKFPMGKVPAFEEGDFHLFETNAIAYYVGNDATRGDTKEAEVLQWLGFADNDLLPAACTWVYPTLGITQYNKQATENAKSEVKNALDVLDKHLLTRTFLVGERVTQADISVACTLLMLYVNVLEPSFRAPYENTNRWFLTVINQPEFKSVLGEIRLCEKMAQFDAKKFNEISGKGGKKEAKKKEIKPKTTTPTTKENDGTGDKTPSDAPAPAKKDPWCNSPKPSMDIDAWKRCYSNSTVDESWKYFVEHFKSEDYSIWNMKYLYNDELNLPFMACNLVRGMMQRLEKLRKHAFGNVFILKDADGKLSIEGTWFWLGHELAFTLSPDWQTDYEIFGWQKLNWDDEQQRKKVHDFWTNEEQFENKEIANVLCYK